MRSIILITDQKYSLSKLNKVWDKYRITHGFVSNDRVSFDFITGRIYVDYSDDNEFDEEDLKHIQIPSPKTFAILYSDHVVLKEFLSKSEFKDSYLIDDDCGNIYTFSDFLKRFQTGTLIEALRGT
jgi:hypothetical protein